jgi:hypothetical protein
MPLPGKLVYIIPIILGEISTLYFSDADRISENMYRKFLSCLEKNKLFSEEFSVWAQY